MLQEVEKCPKCWNYFSVVEFGSRVAGQSTSEIANCPYEGCDGMVTKLSTGGFRTDKLRDPHDRKSVASR